jgi:hypothetical protein
MALKIDLLDRLSGRQFHGRTDVGDAANRKCEENNSGAEPILAGSVHLAILRGAFPLGKGASGRRQAGDGEGRVR